MKKSLFQKQYKKVLLLFFSLIIMFTGCTSLQMSPEELAKQEERLNKLQKEIETGWELLNKNDFQTAMDHFRDLNNQEHFLSAINRGIGVSRFALQDNAEVFESFLSSIKNDPLSPYSVAIAYFISSYTIYDHNEYQEYISILEEVVSSKKTPQWLKNEYNYILFDYYHTKNIDSKKYASIKNDLNILSDWQILGPFSNISQSGFQKDFIEISKQPDSGFNDNLQGKNNWTLSSYTPELENQDIFTPLSKYFSYIDYASIYAFKELEIEEDNVYEFVFSRKGSIEVWLDGEKVIEDRNYTDGNNAFYIKRELEKGSHKIYIKCGNQKKGSTFNASFYPVGGKEYKKSDLYNSLFPDELVYDPLIDGLCRKTEVNNLMESYFWLSFVLIEKGWNDQARAILDKISGMNSDSYLYQWLRAIFSKSINNYNEYEQQMLKLGEQEEIFAPARKYTLSNYIGNKRIGVAKSYLEKIKDYTPNWYYALESEMIIHLIENDNDEAFDVFTKMTSLFPDTPDTYLTMLIYGNKITENQRSRYIEKLYTNGEYKTALYYDYRFAKLGENYEYATSKLLEYLTHYPINENLWNQYIDLLYEDDSFTFLDLRETTKEIGETFPISYDLLMNEKWQSSTLFHEMESYYNENKSLFSSKTPQVNKFLSDMEKEKTAYKQALEKIVLLYPYNLETRDELRELNNMKQFGKELKITDSYFLIDQFEESSFKYDNNDAVIVYNDRKEIFFGDGASTILQHTILKILTLTGVEDNRYQYLEFHPAFGDGVLDEAFILKENGMKIYADRSGRKLAFRGLNPGDYIVIRYSVDSYIPGEINNEIWASSTLQSIYPIFQKDFHLIYPDSYDLDFNYNNISEKDVNQKTDQFIEGYNQKQISVKTTQPLVIKSLSPHWRDTYPWIDASSIKSWDNIIGWYDTLYLGQIEASLPVEKKAMELCEGLDDPNEKIRQLFNYVSNKIEYEDLSFQYSNFIPQTSDSIFRDGYGDCKDQSVLLISMLKAVGIDSYIALNSPDTQGIPPIFLLPGLPMPLWQFPARKE